MIGNLIIVLILFGLVIGCTAITLTKAIEIDMKLAGFEIDGRYIKRPGTNIWCRPAPEFSRSAEVCGER